MKTKNKPTNYQNCKEKAHKNPKNLNCNRRVKNRPKTNIKE